MRARAIENYCYILAPNQFGIDGNGVETYGHTMLIDPQGNVIDVIDKQQKGLLISDLSINDNLKYPFLN